MVLNTVGMQTRLDPSDLRYIAADIYYDDGSGTYVALMAVEGGDRRWLTEAELGMLISLLEKYLHAERSGVNILNGSLPYNRGTKRLERFAKEIDMMYGFSHYPRTAFIQRGFTRKKTESLMCGELGVILPVLKRFDVLSGISRSEI